MTYIEAEKRISKYKDFLSQKTIHFGMSGGVDSSCMAVLMKKMGLDIKAFHLVCWDEGDQCTAQEDLRDALEVASKFNIPMDVIDSRAEYGEFVIKNAIAEYKKGFVPNIDILCNSKIKFDFVIDKLDLGAGDILSTGHYVFTKNFLKNKTFSVPLDGTKDQSYFLSRVIRKDGLMDKLFFPAGLFLKSEIRELAEDLRLSVSKKPDSQGICFIGNVNMKDFLSNYIKPNPGNIVDLAGNIVGKHDGVAFYTVGQRQGLDIYKYSSDPLYIVEKILDKNLLVVGDRESAKKDKLKLRNFYSLLNDDSLNAFIFQNKLEVRFRNLGRFVLVKNIDNLSKDNYAVTLSEKEFGLTPGQEAVFYVDGLLIASGQIDY